MKACFPKLSCHTCACDTSPGSKTPQKNGDFPAVTHLSPASVPLSTSFPMVCGEATLPIYNKFRLQTQSLFISAFHVTAVMIKRFCRAVCSALHMRMEKTQGFFGVLQHLSGLAPWQLMNGLKAC